MIAGILDFLRSLTDPDRLIQLLSTLLTGWLGYTALAAVVFGETGLLLGFFLPGDSLLFTVGVVSGAGELNIALINVLLMASAMIGDSTGFFLGRQTGPRILRAKTRCSSSKSTSRAPSTSTTGTAARRSFSRGLFRWSARSRPSWRVFRKCRTGGFSRSACSGAWDGSF